MTPATDIHYLLQHNLILEFRSQLDSWPLNPATHCILHNMTFNLSFSLHPTQFDPWPLSLTVSYTIWLLTPPTLHNLILDPCHSLCHTQFDPLLLLLTASYTICSGLDSTMTLVSHFLSRGFVSRLKFSSEYTLFFSSFWDMTILGVPPSCGEPTTSRRSILPSTLKIHFSIIRLVAVGNAKVRDLKWHFLSTYNLQDLITVESFVGSHHPQIYILN